MSIAVHLCPVCRQAVKSTTRGNVPAHLDSLRTDTCPMTGEKFALTLMVTPEFQGVSS